MARLFSKSVEGVAEPGRAARAWVLTLTQVIWGVGEITVPGGRCLHAPVIPAF